MSRRKLRAVPLAVFLALRYLRSTRKDAFVSFLCTLTAGGLSLGVGALILALSALSGFQTELLGDILDRTPQLEILPPPVAEGGDLERMAEVALRVEGVAGVQEVLWGRGWLLYAGSLKPVELVGFERLPPAWFPGTPDVPARGLFLPESLAREWNLWAGDRVLVVSPRPTLTPVGPKPRSRRLPLSGTYREGRSEADLVRVALPMEAAVALLGRSDQRLDVELEAGADATVVGRLLRESLAPGTEVRSWRDLQRPLMFVLRLEKAMIFLAVLLIVVVASFALVGSLALIITSRLPEIGALGAMGASPRQMHQSFLLLGALLAGLGTVVGGALGMAGALVCDRFELLSLPGDVYIVDHVPFQVRFVDIALVLGASVALTLTASFWGARRAAALRPVEALRR